jgi:hypothetical protein
MVKIITIIVMTVILIISTEASTMISRSQYEGQEGFTSISVYSKNCLRS